VPLRACTSAGKIDQWYYKTDKTGVVFIMNLSDAGEARALLEGLPLGQAGMMESISRLSVR
jgi:hypothetical protein